jgi:hypothetical protein
VKYVLEKRVWTDQRWVEGVVVGGGQPGSDAKEWRSLLVDQFLDVEPIHGGVA